MPTNPDAKGVIFETILPRRGSILASVAPENVGKVAALAGSSPAVDQGRPTSYNRDTYARLRRFVVIGTAVLRSELFSIKSSAAEAVVLTSEREQFRTRLADAGVGTAVHYPTPIHRQPAYTELDVEGGFPVAEELTGRIVSLPISADHSEDEILQVAAAAVG